MEGKDLFYYLAEAVQVRYSDAQIALFLSPRKRKERKELRDKLLRFIYKLEQNKLTYFNP